MAANTYKNSNLDFLSAVPLNRGMVFGVIIITALLAFEIFNYGTTDYALTDLLGPLSFMGLRWATILAIAFCGIDFAGIARLFAPELGNMRNESWYLFGAWLLAATMNAMLTWWGVSLAILNNQAAGNAVIERTTILRVAPIFVAILVWLIRVLIIGTFSVAGDRLFQAMDAQAQPAARPASQPAANRPTATPTASPQNRPATSQRPPATASAPLSAAPVRKTTGTLVAAPRPTSQSATPRAAFSPVEPEDPPEPEYTPLDYSLTSERAKAPVRPASSLPGSDPRATPVRRRS